MIPSILEFCIIIFLENIQKGVDSHAKNVTLLESRAEQSRAEQSRAEHGLTAPFLEQQYDILPSMRTEISLYI